MMHLDDRSLLELRDGLPVDADLRGHLEGCPACREALSVATARAARIEGTLTALDEDFDVTAAREAVRARLAGGGTRSENERSPHRSPWTMGSWSLGKAAALLLVVTGAAAALPGSPVRGWLAGGEGRQPVPESASTTQTPDMVGGRLTVTQGPVTIELEGVPEGTEIGIRWVSGSAVTVRAAAGTAFSYGQARVSANVAGGPVSVEVPAALEGVSLVVNERTYMVGESGDLAVTGPVTERTDSTITFIVSGD